MGGAAVRGQGRDDATSSSSRRSSTRSRSAGPASATPSAPRPASASRRARSSGSPGSARTGRRGSSPSGPAAPSPRAASTRRPTSPSRARVAFRPARVNRLLGTDARRPTSSATLLARVGVETGAGRRGRSTIAARRRARSRSTGRRPTRRRGARRDRADLAPRHRDRGRRRRGGRPRPRLRADPGRSCPTRRCRAYRHSPLEVRDAIRETLAGAGLTEVVTHALVVAAARRGVPLGARRCRPVEGEPPEGGRPIIVTNPLSADHSVLRPALVGSLVEIVSTNLRHGRDDVAIFEIGKGYGARRATAVREWWRLGLAADRRGASRPSWNRPARPYDLDDAKGVDRAALRAGSGFDAPTYAPLERASRCSIRAGRRGSTAAARRPTRRSPASSASSTRRSPRRGTCAAPASSSPSSTSPASAGGQLPPSRPAPPPRHPAARARPRGRRRRGLAGRRRRRGDPRRRGGRRSRAVRLFDVYRGAPLGAGREEPRLPARRSRRRTGRSTEAEIDAAIAAITERDSAASRRPDQDLSPACDAGIPRCYPVPRLAAAVPGSPGRRP